MKNPAIGSLKEVIHSILSGSDRRIILINPSESVMSNTIKVSYELDNSPSLHILSERSILKSLRRRFLVASRAADLLSNGTLELRITQFEPGNSLFVFSDSVTVLISAGSEAAAVSINDSTFVDVAEDVYGNRWKNGEEFDIRTPALSVVDGSLRDVIGPQIADEFISALDYLEEIGANEFDIVVLILLLAARHNVLQYEISHWGENVGVASSATFSRTKSELEERNLIGSDKVPQDVGRPRFRLKLVDGKIDDNELEELINSAWDAIVY